MRTHTLLTKIASIAVCFGVMMSGPVMAGTNGIIKDVELSKEGTLVGQVFTPAGKAVSNATVFLRYQGKAVAAAKSDAKGSFAIADVRGGAHEIVVGALNSPVRLWGNGTAPKGATKGLVVSANETIVRGQDPYCNTCPPDGGACNACPPSGFGMLDVITLASVGAGVGALVVGLDNRDTLKDIQSRNLNPASP